MYNLNYSSGQTWCTWFAISSASIGSIECIVKPHCSDFGIITAVFGVSEFLDFSCIQDRPFWPLNHNHKYMYIFSSPDSAHR